MADEEVVDAEPRSSFHAFWWHVRKNFRFDRSRVWEEVSGSMGDLGTFIPLVLSMAFVNGLDLGTTLIFTGAYNIITGILFGVPMPVQPMKYIYTAAISDDPMAVPEIMAAGLCTGLVLFVCGVTRVMNIVTRLVPTPVIRGFQLSQGISFGMTAVKYIVYDQDFNTGEQLGLRIWSGTDGVTLALAALVFMLLASGPGDDMSAQEVLEKKGVGGKREKGPGRRGSLRHSLLEEDDDEAGDISDEEVQLGKQLANLKGLQPIAIPSALMVFVLGVILALIRDPGFLSRVQFGPTISKVIKINREDWKRGFLRAAVGQIPLSLISTVVGVTKMSHTLFPQKRNVTANYLSTTVGAFNLVGCLFGTMPVECGAGGLAAQFRFGARDGWSVVMLGGAKLFIGLLLGSSLLRLLAKFPIGLLGVLLLLAGSELAMFCRDQTSRFDVFVMIICATVSLSGLGAPLGFACGYTTYFILKLRHYCCSRDLWILNNLTVST